MSLSTIANLCISKRNLYLGCDDLEKMQLKKLKNLLTFAYHDVPFYHNKLKKVGLRPDDIQKLEDVRRIPFTEKSEIQDTALEEMIARNVNINDCVKNRTSGSSGMPLTTLAGIKTDKFDGTMWLRAYFLNGMRLRDKMLVVKDLSSHAAPSKRWVEYFGIMRRKYASVFDESRILANFITKEKPEIIESYPSSLVIIADMYEDLVTVKPRLIFTLAELLDKKSRDLIKNVFKAELFDYYGSAEIGLMAWECGEHSNYHMSADNVLMESVGENGETLGPGEVGEIVCTNLYNYEMPIIRYKHGDIGATVLEDCKCGVKLPLMKIAGGRKDDYLQTTDGKMVAPTVFFPYPFDHFEKIRQFRVIQETRNKIKIQIVLKQKLDSDMPLEKARKKIQDVFGQEMEVEFEILEHLVRDPSGKIRKIISRI